MAGRAPFYQRPFSASTSGNQPIPLRFSELDYLFVRVALRLDDMNREDLVQALKMDRSLPLSLYS